MKRQLGQYTRIELKQGRYIKFAGGDMEIIEPVKWESTMLWSLLNYLR